MAYGSVGASSLHVYGVMRPSKEALLLVHRNDSVKYHKSASDEEENMVVYVSRRA